MSEENNIEIAFINLLKTILEMLTPEEAKHYLNRFKKMLEELEKEYEQ